MAADAYEGFAERYDWMKHADPARTEFFRRLFTEHNVISVLDCACGTGSDLLMFRAMNLKAFGSDISESMLAEARKRTASTDIILQKADFCYLPNAYSEKFDAVVCLNNSINEVLDDSVTLRALHGMRAVLRSGGLLVIDQGQTDALMLDPPRFVPVVNNRDFTRLFTMAYSSNIMTVSIFDFTHTEDILDFSHYSVQIRIRLLDNWKDMLREAGFEKPDFFGDWSFTPYDKKSSQRLIAVARK